MNKKQIIAIIVMLVAGLLFATFVVLKDNKSQQAETTESSEKGGHEHAKGHADTEHHGDNKTDTHDENKGHADTEHHKDGPTKGPHGGQLFIENNFGLEVALVEDGGEARFRIYLSEKGKPLPPTAAKVGITLNRPDGEKQEIAFTSLKDALQSTTVIAEPHIFDATIAAQTGKEAYLFTFIQEEGKIELTDAQITASGVSLQTAGAARIKSSLQMPGEIRFNDDRTAHVVPRVQGIVESVPANLGQQVKKGAVLAVLSSTALSEQRSELLAAQKRVEFARATYAREKQLWEEKISALQDFQKSQQDLREAEIAFANAQQKLKAIGANPSSVDGLSRFELRAPFDGMVVEKHITMGESIKEDANAFTLSDLSTVWAEIVVPAKDLDQVRVGSDTIVRSTTSDAKVAGKVTYVGSLIGEQTRSAKARVELTNPKLAWRPGLYVSVELTSSEADVPIAVVADAVQSVNDKPVVFMRVPGGFIAQPVTTGRTDGKQVEIVKGLKSGVEYAAAGSFVIKAELGKGSASHSH